MRPDGVSGIGGGSPALGGPGLRRPWLGCPSSPISGFDLSKLILSVPSRMRRFTLLVHSGRSVDSARGTHALFAGIAPSRLRLQTGRYCRQERGPGALPSSRAFGPHERAPHAPPDLMVSDPGVPSNAESGFSVFFNRRERGGTFDERRDFTPP